MNSWYSIVAKADESADVMIYDVIGAWGVDANALCNELRGIKARTINVHMNTPGGSVFDGMAIYNTLKAHSASVVCHVEGLAASIGSIIALAGDETRMGEGTFMMIHNPSALAMGDADEMRRNADMLDKVSGSMAQIYADKTGMSVEECRQAMDDETWYTAAEAKAAGFADAVDDQDEDEPDESAAAAAQFDFKVMALDHSRRREFVASRLSVPKQQQQQQQKPAARAAANPPPNQEQPVTLDQFKAFAAANPDAVASFIQQGYDKAKAELTPKPATATEMKAAFPAHTGFIVDQLGVNATLPQAKAAFGEVLIAEHTAAIAAKDAEIARLGKIAGMATSGAAALNTEAPPAQGGAAQPPADDADPKVHAEWEWDNKPEMRKGYTTKDRYVAIRSRELTGNFQASGPSLVRKI